MAQGDPAGWESLGVNDPTRYQATFTYTRSQGSGQVNQRVKVITNRSNGNYDVYTTAFGVGDQLIYSYNASNNNTTVSNQGVYDQIFTGPRSNQLSNLNSGVRKATLQLAENNVSGGPNSIFSRQLQKLKNSQGYQSLANTAPPSAPKKDPPLPLDPGPGPGPGPGGDQDPGEGFTLTAEQKQAQGFSKNSPSILVYPRDHGSSGFDFLKIRALEYVAGIGLDNIPTNGIKTVQERTPRTNQIGPTVCLPMAPGISESNSIGWGSDELNPLQAAFGNAAIDIIRNPGIGANGIDLTQVQNNLQNLGTQAANIANAPGLSKFISAYFGGQAVQANLVGRAGIVINPNMELLFQGPKLRSFRYSFKFTPRDSLEAKEIRRIIRFFKKTSAPKRPSGSLFLGVPSIYELKYIYNSGTDGTKEHPFLNKLKLCALTSFNINYAPDGSYMTYQDGSMTSYTIDMQFDELEPIYNEDISQSLESETMDY